MEKKTIGSFIAALRKANGLTQKQLADMLNVSDKAVSRWERDECAPDLSVIPVLAEIFSVTSDEILRGQRANPDGLPKASDAVRSQRQRAHLMRSVQNQFRIRSILYGFLALLGSVLAFILNTETNAPNLGFLISLIFCLAAVILQITGLIAAGTSLGDEDNDEEIRRYKLSMRYWSETIIAACFIALALVIPMAGRKETVSFLSCLTDGCKWALRTAILCLAVFLILDIIHVLRYKGNGASLSLICRTITALLLIIVLIGHMGLNTFLLNNRHIYSPCNSISTLDDFKFYMETPLCPEGFYCEISRQAQEASDTSNYVYIYINPYTDEKYVYTNEDLIEILIPPSDSNWPSENRFNPELGYEFQHFNRTVVYYEISNDTDIVPIYTFNAKQFQQSEEIATNYSLIYCAAYLIPIGIGYALYFLLRKRHK